MLQTTHLKPVAYDIHLKYLCEKCGGAHWLSYKEASTQNFKVVCDCDNVFEVARLSGFEIEYEQEKSQTKEHKPQIKEVKVDQAIPDDILNSAIRSLNPYGFTESEAKELVVQSYKNCPNNNVSILVKQVLQSLRNTNV